MDDTIPTPDPALKFKFAPLKVLTPKEQAEQEALLEASRKAAEFRQSLKDGFSKEHGFAYVTPVHKDPYPPSSEA